MALSIDKAPVYGGNTLVVEFPVDVLLSREASYYIVYEGSIHRLLTGARVLTEHKLHSLVPAHREAESVHQSILCYHGDSSSILATNVFHFYNDSAFYLAQFLIDSVYNPTSLEDFELIKSEHFDISNEELSTLDQRLSRALSFLDIPDWWNLLGGDQNTANPSPRETVLHFSARLGLNRVATYFLAKPGSQTALRLPNHQGNLPRDVALIENYPGLAELLSEYNVYGLMPLSRRFVIESAIIQTQETGDVILRTDLSKQHRHVDEDIALLCQVRRKLEQEESPIHLRQWQTDWPLHEQQQTDWPLPQPEQEDQYQQQFSSHLASQQLDEELDHQRQVHQVGDILQKSHEIQDSLKNYMGYYENVDLFADTNLSDQQEENPFVPFPEDSMNMNSPYGASADSLDQNEAGSYGFGESVGALRAYNEHLQQVCEQDVAYNRNLEQDLRKQHLARFSSSCPSLDAEGRGSPLPTINEGDHSSSLYDLAEDSGSDGLEPTSISHSHEFYTSGQQTSQPSIVISGDSVDSTSDTRIQQQEYDSYLDKYIGGNVPNIRRRSWNPEDGNQKQNVTDQCEEGDEMLQYVGKSMSLSSLDERGGGVESEDNNSFPSGLKVGHVSPINHSAGAEGRRYIISSSGDSNFSRDTGQDLSDMRDVGEYVSVTSTPVQRWGNDRPACSLDQKQEMENFVDSSTQGHHMQSPQESDDIMEESESEGTSQPPAMYAPLSGAHHTNITKALSLSSIPNATDLADNQGFFRKKQGRDGSKQQLNLPSHLLIQKLVAEHDAQLHRQQEMEEDEEDGFKTGDRGNAKSRTRKKGEVSLLDFLNESVVPSTDESRGKKDEKKRKTSVFSRFNSYRKGKQKDKDLKNRSAHQLVSISFSNNTPCDVCSKSLTNKPALCCEICLMNVHDSSCKDQMTICNKLKQQQRAQRSSGAPAVEGDGMSAYGDKTGLSQSAPTHQPLRPSYSFKEKRPVTLRPQSQLSPNGQIHRRSLPTPRRAITEEGETDSASSGLDGDQSNIKDSNISQSTESLEQIDGGATPESGNDDHELDQLNVTEPETWSVTAEKKLLKKMGAKDIKRQDTIWELIQTEKHHCKTLVILNKLFREHMLMELDLPCTYVDRIFPRLDDLMEIHKKFLSQLRELQSLKPDRSIDEIGPTLISQFSGQTGVQMKAAYGDFCSGHKEAVLIYKDLLTSNSRFLSLVKRRSNYSICEKREIPDFILLITQRPTKYPTLIESILKSTKDKKDRENLSRALDLSKEILQSVDEQVADYERQLRLKEIHQKMESKSTSVYRGKKFKKSDLLAQGRRLVYEGTVGWRNARGKTTEVIAVLLTDVMFFMQESNQKYNFFSADNKYGVVPLFNLLVREKGDTRDSKGFYLISQNKQMPEMYELVCRTASERHSWITILQKTVEKCPEDEKEEDNSEDEEEKKREKRAAKAKEIMQKMRKNDEDIKNCCNEKNRLMLELLTVYNSNEDSSSRPGSREFEEGGLENMGTLQAAIQGAASQLTTMLECSSTNLSRSVSSAGEHSTSSFAALQVPKRAETFGGFDAPLEGPKVVPKKKLTAEDTESPRASLYRDESEFESSQLQDSPASGSVKFDSSHDVDSGRDSSPGGFSSASLLLSPMSAHISTLAATQEQASIANLLQTLHSIVHLTASQSTAVESLRVQLAEANEKINKLSADVHHERKSGYRHNQLEELRNLQSQIQKEKKDWEIQRDKERQQLEWERSLLDEQRKEQEKKEQEIKSQREDLRTEREKFQRQIDLLQQQGRLPRDMPLPKNLSAPNDFPSQLELAKASSVDTEDRGQVQSNLDFLNGHRRSASADFYQSVPEDLEKIRQGKIESKLPKERFVERRPSGHNVQNVHTQALPEHLLSAKNEQRIGPKKVQKIPSKLASSSALTTTSPLQSQMLPVNLAKNTSGQLSQQLSGSHSNSNMMHLSASGSQITNVLGNNSFPHSGSSSQLVGSGSVSGANSSSSNYQNQSSNFSQSTSNVPIAKHSNRPPPTGSTSSLGLVMKLAEPGGGGGHKTRTSGSNLTQEKHLAPQVIDQHLPRQQPAVTQGSEQQTPPRQPQSQGPERPISMGPEKFQGLNINHKPQKSDSDVIYF